MNQNISSSQFGPPTTPKQKEPSNSNFANLDKAQVLKRMKRNSNKRDKLDDEYGYSDDRVRPREGTPIRAKMDANANESKRLRARLKDVT